MTTDHKISKARSDRSLVGGDRGRSSPPRGGTGKLEPVLPGSAPATSFRLWPEALTDVEAARRYGIEYKDPARATFNPPKFEDPKEWTPRRRPPLEVRTKSKAAKVMEDSTGGQWYNRHGYKGLARARWRYGHKIRWGPLVTYKRGKIVSVDIPKWITRELAKKIARYRRLKRRLLPFFVVMGLERGFSQRELARLAEVSVATINNVKKANAERREALMLKEMEKEMEHALLLRQLDRIEARQKEILDAIEKTVNRLPDRFPGNQAVSEAVEHFKKTTLH
jgi:transcriptional regulator with XRE-family HTH domain